VSHGAQRVPGSEPYAATGTLGAWSMSLPDFGLALSTAYRGTTTLLGYVVEADDQYTGAHSRDVVDLSRTTAATLGLSASQRRSAR